jgi:hypothetical protein
LPTAAAISNLFAASELRSYFADHFDIDELCGIDLFHSRFAPDPRWNPASLAVDKEFCNVLERLEETYAKSSGFMERATHLMLVARRRQIAAMNEPEPNFGPGINFPAACARLPDQRICSMPR